MSNSRSPLYHYLFRPRILSRGIRLILHLPRRALAFLGAKVWRGISAHRYLLSLSPHVLSFDKRLKRTMLIWLLGCLDPYYKFRLYRFDNVLRRKTSWRSRGGRGGLLCVIGTLGPGGAERQLVYTLNGLVGRGCKSIGLVCLFLREEWQRFFLPQIKAAHLPVEELPRDSSGDYESIGSVIGLINFLPLSLHDVQDYMRTFAKHKPEVVHLWLDECNVKGGVAAIAVGVPKIVLGLRSLPPCNFPLHQPYMREGYRWLARQPNVIFVNNSAAGAREYEKWLGLSNGKIRVVHNACSFSSEQIELHKKNRVKYRKKLGIPVNSIVIGTVCRISEEKRPFLWLDIAEEVARHRPDVYFLVVGDGPLRVEMEFRCLQKRINGKVHFAGYEKEPLEAIAAMEMFLMTSYAEGLPNVLLEAQAMGVPVVTTNAGGAIEAVQHGETGWVLDQADYGHVATVLLKLLGDRKWYEQACLKAPLFVEECFGMERMLDETLDIYGDSIGP